MNPKRRFLFLCLLSFFFSVLGNAQETTCRNPEGKAVAWWVAIKTPNTLNDYIYRDADSSTCEAEGSCWGVTRHNLSDPEQGPLSETLQQIYKAPKDNPLGYLMYNDDTSVTGSSATHSGYAHAKGVLATGLKGGFWLVHSVPRFPRDQAGTEPYTGVTKNGRINGQSFLCLSLGIDHMKGAMSQLYLAHPFIYQKGGFSDDLRKLLGDNTDALLGEREASEKTSQANTVMLNATNGTLFTSFMKSKHWGKDLYDDLVSQALNSDLFVETWNNGRGTLPTFCRNPHCVNPEECGLEHDVANVTEVQIDNSIGWVNHKDHSKWAVTVPTAATHTVCIGDINRQHGQRVRGGGTVCVADESLWKAFHGMIKAADTCATN